jgi:FkbM family methyltransferase
MEKRKIKQFLKKTPIVGSLFIYLNKRFKNKQPALFDSPTNWLAKFLQGDEVNIVQIGSNDGVHGDPIYKLIKKNTKWKALFVEPIPYLFERLKTNYGTDVRFSFENVAINEGVQQTFYSVKEEAIIDIPNLPSWYDQLGSFNKENILKHLDGILEPYILETQLSGMSLNELFYKYEIQDLTLLHIDAEGYDWNILSQLDLDKIRPIIILFEHKHLNKTERINSINFLKETYLIFELGPDFICTLRSHIKKHQLKDLKGELVT